MTIIERLRNGTKDVGSINAVEENMAKSAERSTKESAVSIRNTEEDIEGA